MAENLLLQKSQFALTADEDVKVYTCPANRTNTVTVFLCNRGIATTFQLSLRIDGEGADPKQFLYYNVDLPASNTMKLTITLNENDELWAYIDAGGVVSCNVFVDQSLKLRK